MQDVSYIKKDIGLIFENVDATTVKTKKFRVRLISEGESGIMGSKIRCNALADACSPWRGTINITTIYCDEPGGNTLPGSPFLTSCYFE